MRHRLQGKSYPDQHRVPTCCSELISSSASPPCFHVVFIIIHVIASEGAIVNLTVPQVLGES